MFMIIPPKERKKQTIEQIEQIYDGKWILVTHAKLTRGLRLIEGIPTVIADSAFEGAKTGLYDEFEKEEYGSISTTDLTHMAGHIASALWEVAT